MIPWLLTWLFGPPEQINGHGRCPTYLYRWAVVKLWGHKLYVHRFVGDDWSYDLHDHPKRFWSLMVWGGYHETTPRGTRHYTAPFLRTFPPEHAHRVELREHDVCWTLVVVCRGLKQWGFYHNGEWIHWREYVRGRFSHLADLMAVCRRIEEES